MSQKTLKILLVISFAANLLVAGAVGGFFGSGRHKDLRLDYTGKTQEARPRGPSSGLGPLLRAMDRKDRRELGRLIQVAQGKSGGMTRDARQAKNIEFAQAVRATPFDGAAILTLMEAESAESSRRLELSRNVLVEKVATMSPEVRAKLAESLLNGRK